jgi:hypothetical protein
VVQIATATAATTIRPAMDAATEGNAAGKNAGMEFVHSLTRQG